MSNDLISRKTLLDALEAGKDKVYEGKTILEVMKEIAESQPTAFDRGKVHSELIELRNAEVFKPDSANKYDEARSQGRYSAFLDAIRIVEKGGIE